MLVFEIFFDVPCDCYLRISWFRRDFVQLAVIFLEPEVTLWGQNWSHDTLTLTMENGEFHGLIPLLFLWSCITSLKNVYLKHFLNAIWSKDSEFQAIFAQFCFFSIFFLLARPSYIYTHVLLFPVLFLGTAKVNSFRTYDIY